MYRGRNFTDFRAERVETKRQLVEGAGAVYVARWTTFHVRQLAHCIQEAFKKKGFSFIEIISPCPASHVIVWKPNNTAGWVKFTPLKFDSSEPFGHAYATLIYSWNKADGSDGLNLTEGAFDYVVCVLDSAMGDATGWMGSRSYDTGWDGGNYWGHVGYPQDLAGGARPAFIGYQSFIGESSASIGSESSYRIRHEIDVIPGQSGGPYFGWWNGEAWPRVVGTQSGQNLGGTGGDNTCGGGNPLSDLINYARNASP